MAHTRKKAKVIHSLVKNKHDPLADWPTFIIDIRGETETYEKAELVLADMKRKKYGFTTDATEEPEERLKRIKNMYCLEYEEKLKKADLKAIFEVPNLNKEFEMEDSKSSEGSENNVSSSSSDSSSTNQKKVTKKFKVKNKKKKSKKIQKVV
ncbi:uncharacterized protein LOC122502434 [Leptopilina heterotoma]|uniref:uncharacterized protein LOC122502434 n=1 Tax=Leptopilina heterotoma TaxID=63436 RepID=UPI001CA97A14|nr:uncharacterized protein LOC122502434 [Leptopilina heterotoma]